YIAAASPGAAVTAQTTTTSGASLQSIEALGAPAVARPTVIRAAGAAGGGYEDIASASWMRPAAQLPICPAWRPVGASQPHRWVVTRYPQWMGLATVEAVKAVSRVGSHNTPWILTPQATQPGMAPPQTQISFRMWIAQAPTSSPPASRAICGVGISGGVPAVVKFTANVSSNDNVGGSNKKFRWPIILSSDDRAAGMYGRGEGVIFGG
ncbi:hypothetical protein VaNZ11_012655, partial [Volvox africanus]